MAIYLLNILITAVLAAYYKQQSNSLEEGGNQSHRWMFPLSILLVCWVSIYALRGLTGSDSINYYSQYRIAYMSNTPLSRLFSSYRDKLYQFVVYCVGKLSHGSWICLCAAVGLLIYFPIIKVVKDESKDIVASCLLYIFILSFFFGFNGVKQGISISFAMLAYYSGLKKKRYVLYAILMLIAYGFHGSTILILPFQILSMVKFKSLWMKIVLIGMIVGGFFLVRFWGNLIDLIEAVGQDKIASDYANTFSRAHGSGILRTLVAAAPVIFAWFFYQDASVKNPDIDYEINMVAFGSVFMIYSMQNWIFAQMAEYFMVFAIILIPKVLDCFEERYRHQYRFLILALYFVYMIAILLHGDGTYYPYKPVWLGGA